MNIFNNPDIRQILELAGVDISKGKAAQLIETKTVSSSRQSTIDVLIEKLGQALAKEAVTLATEVYDKEGPGKSSKQTKEEYVKYAVKQFMSNEYKNDIMANIVESYNDSL